MFSVIIATCGRPDRLRVALESVRRAAAPVGGCRVIVVDNHPDYAAEAIVKEFAEDRPALTRRSGVSETGEEDLQTGTRAAENVETLNGRTSARAATNLESRIPNPDFTYLHSTPFNKARALNVGIAAAETEWLAFTDDDTLPEEEWLAEGARYAASSGCRVFGGRVVPGLAECGVPRWLVPGASGRLAGGGVLVSYDPARESGTLPGSARVPYGANVFVRRDAFADHGGYDEVLWGLCGKAALGVDDGEFGVRLQREGEPIGYCREATVVHPVHVDRFSIRSHWLTAWHYGWRDPFVFLDPREAIMPLYRWRLLARLQARFVRDMLKRDYAGALDDVFGTGIVLGRIAGRLSPGYRRWVVMKDKGYKASSPCASR